MILERLGLDVNKDRSKEECLVLLSPLLEWVVNKDRSKEEWLLALLSPLLEWVVAEQDQQSADSSLVAKLGHHQLQVARSLVHRDHK